MTIIQIQYATWPACTNRNGHTKATCTSRQLRSDGIPTIVQKWKLSLQGSYGDKQMLRDSHGDGKNMREFHRNEDAFMITLPLLRLQRPKNCQQPASNQIPTISKAPVSISCNYQQYIPVLIIMWITWHGKNFRRDGPGWKLGWNCGIGRDKNKKNFFRMGVFCVTMQRHGTTETLVLLYCTLSLAAQCIVIGPICVWVCLWVCYHDNSKLLKHWIVCINLHQTGSVGEGSDHLQLIKFWLSCTPGKGVCGWGENFWVRLITASVCVSPSAFSFNAWLNG